MADEVKQPADGGSWGEWFFLGLLLPLGVLGLVLFASGSDVLDVLRRSHDGLRREDLGPLFLPLVVAGIAVVWVPVTFTWARDRPLTRRGRVLLLALAVAPGAALVVAGAAAAVLAFSG